MRNENTATQFSVAAQTNFLDTNGMLNRHAMKHEAISADVSSSRAHGLTAPANEAAIDMHGVKFAHNICCEYSFFRTTGGNAMGIKGRMQGNGFQFVFADNYSVTFYGHGLSG